MRWVAVVSQAEHERQELPSQATSTIVAAFEKTGVILLKNVFDVSLIDAAYREWMKRYGELDLAAMTKRVSQSGPNRLLEVGDGRFEVTIEMTGAFGELRLFANRIVSQLMIALLGPGVRLNSFSVVVSHPGAPLQHIHRDHGHLFEESEATLPVYAVNVAVPLIDVDLDMGPTAAWAGSHRQQSVEPTGARSSEPFERGDCMMVDYRTLHAGLPNRSSRPRPVLYIVYARPWFFDEVNHLTRSAVDMPLEEYKKLPADVRPLLSRALASQMRLRSSAPLQPSATIELAHVPSDEGGPRCPCGNGRAFASCHGKEA